MCVCINTIKYIKYVHLYIIYLYTLYRFRFFIERNNYYKKCNKISSILLVTERDIHMFIRFVYIQCLNSI